MSIYNETNRLSGGALRCAVHIGRCDAEAYAPARTSWPPRVMAEGAERVVEGRPAGLFRGVMRVLRILLAAAALIATAGCGPSGPTEYDMVGCAVRGGGPPISSREVADCAVERAEIRQRERK